MAQNTLHLVALIIPHVSSVSKVDKSSILDLIDAFVVSINDDNIPIQARTQALWALFILSECEELKPNRTYEKLINVDSDNMWLKILIAGIFHFWLLIVKELYGIFQFLQEKT